MIQYFFVDESGDPGLDGDAGSSSHFVVAMVQLPNRAPLDALTHVRQALGFPDTFEFKYHKTAMKLRQGHCPIGQHINMGVDMNILCFLYRFARHIKWISDPTRQ